MLKFKNILNNIYESPDIAYRKGYLHGVEYFDSNSYPFGFVSNNFYLGAQKQIHSQLCQSYGILLNDLKYSGRIWLNENIISLWEYPRTNSEMKNILLAIKNKFKEKYNIDININKLMIEIVVDIVDGKIVLDKKTLILAASEMRDTEREITKRNFSIYKKNRFRNFNISLNEYDTNKKFLNENKLFKTLNETVSTLEKAELIVLQTHFWQTRREGDSYLTHLLRTFKRCLTMGYDKNIQILALLHDAIEDSPYPEKTKELIRKTFKDGDKIVKQLDLITHKEGDSYSNYVLNIWKKSPNTVFKVKMMDMLDNLKNPSTKQFIKYRNAIQYLIDQGVSKNNIPDLILNKLNLK